MEVIRRWLRKREEGQDMIEYAVLAAFISIVAITVIKTIGPLITTVYTNIVTALTP
jgi:pilus assembly protein Flp/PilA